MVAGATSFHLKLQHKAENARDMRGFGISKPAPSEVLPPSRPRLLHPPSKHKQLETKCSTMRVSKVYSQCIKVEGVMMISKKGSSLKIVL